MSAERPEDAIQVPGVGPPYDPRATYVERLTRHGSARDAAARRSFLLSNVRGATFLGAAGAFVAFDVLEPPLELGALGLGIALALAFLVQVILHRRVRRTERWEEALANVARESLLRLDRDWDALDEALPEAERRLEEPEPGHAYGRDLDVTGRASLTRLLGPVTSERGRSRLAAWLLANGSSETAIARHGAVRELAPLSGLRAEFTALGRVDGPASLEGLDRFLVWAEGDVWAASRTGLRLAAWLLPPVLLTGLTGQVLFDWTPWWVLPAVAQLIFLRHTKPRTGEAFRLSVLGGAPLRAIVPQLGLLSGRDWRDPHLASVADRLGHGEGSAHRSLARLSRRLDTVESRRNMVYGILALFFLLDFHLCVALDRWRRSHGHAVREWLEALGTWEALSALATLAHDHPRWAYPTFVEKGPGELRGTALGHPLLHPERCVKNDVVVGPPGTFLFVTGSNMSGKSTLLRAVGANAVLANAGAPVCARTLSLPPVRVHTSMRIEDSLAEGVSLFMAELLRIKGIVEVADPADAGGRPVLYLLDEMLHGTNTAERQVAARGVIRHLIASGAIGAVSTHDLALADAQDLAQAARAVHFREHVERGGERERTKLTFDYKLRAGVATTRNALKLLAAVGLGDLELEGMEPPADRERDAGRGGDPPRPSPT